MGLGTQQQQSPQDLLLRPDVVPKSQAPPHQPQLSTPPPQSDIMNLMLNVLQGVQSGTLMGNMMPEGLINPGQPQRPMPRVQAAASLGSGIAEPMPDVMPLLGGVLGMLGKTAKRMKAPVGPAGHTLERLGDIVGQQADENMWGALQSDVRMPDPPPLNLKKFEQQANETFNFRSLESSDHYSRFDARPVRGPKTPVLHDNNPLTEAILQGATEPYIQSWGVRDPAGDLRWVIESRLEVFAIPTAQGVREAPTLVTDIGSAVDEGTFSYQTEAGFNEMGLPALRETASNILAWYKQHGLKPEYVGGWRVRLGRDRQMTVPAEKLEREFSAAWIAAFGAAAIAPRIILEQSSQPAP